MRSALVAGLMWVGACGGCSGAGPSATQPPPSSTPVSLAPLQGGGESAVVAWPRLVAGLSHHCLLRSTGDVVCWGNNNQSQAGVETNGAPTSPVVVQSFGRARALAAGDLFTCAALESGAVRCVGAAGAFDRTSPRAAAFEVPGLTGVVALAAGQQSTCAIDVGAQVSCWGNNDFGQLGDGTHDERAGVVRVGGAHDAVSVAAGEAHACFTRASGRVACFGKNNDAQVGVAPELGGPGFEKLRIPGGFREYADGRCEQMFEERVLRMQPVEVPGLAGARVVRAGRAQTCAIETGGGVVCWGSRERSAGGTYDVGEDAPRAALARVRGISGARSLSLGYESACAVDGEGRVLCWGINAFGSFASTRTDSPLPPTEITLPARAKEVAVGWNTACALLVDERVACWGKNDQGQLGDRALGAVVTTPVLVVMP